MSTEPPIPILPSTSELLVSGGDSRIRLNPETGLSIYGCCPYPEHDLIALGSSTASVISERGYLAAEMLRETMVARLQSHSPAEVYAEHAQRIRSQLLELCGFSAADRAEVVLAASGTDLHVMATQWMQPQKIIMVASAETGSGVRLAVQGKHFNPLTANSCAVRVGDSISDWQGDLATVSARNLDGSLRDQTEVDAEYYSLAESAAASGQRVLLIVTDISKTGLILPSAETLLALKQRWSSQLEVLVDACQFRLSTVTLRAYLALGCVVAVTGSKFIGGPTFCGALLVPEQVSDRYRTRVLSGALNAYSNADDWPHHWAAAHSLAASTNFGLLLRWQAALAEFQAFLELSDQQIDAFLQQFAQALCNRLDTDPGFERLPLRELRRVGLTQSGSWDTRQTIFSFMVRAYSASSMRIPLHRDEMQSLYKRLRTEPFPATGMRYHVGQPVLCGTRDGVPVSALRICVGARMIVEACSGDGADSVIAATLAALDAINRIVSDAQEGRLSLTQ